MGFGPGVSHQHGRALGGCAAAPWSCIAPRLPASIDEGFCVASDPVLKQAVNVHCTCLGMASTDGVRGRGDVLSSMAGSSMDAPRLPVLIDEGFCIISIY